MGLLDRFRRRSEAIGDCSGFVSFACETPQGIRHLVSVLTAAQVERIGRLPPEGIVGSHAVALREGDVVPLEGFSPNPRFVELLHDVVRIHAPATEELQRGARSNQEGWVYLIDQRTPTPSGNVPCEDIVGGFRVENGEIGAYEPMTAHRLLTANGFFRLPDALHERLVHEILQRATLSS